MSNWITITEADLRAYQLDEYIEAARNLLAPGQSDPLDEIVAAVITRIRAEVRGCASNVISATPNTIPPDLKTAAIFLVLEPLQGRSGISFPETIKTQIEDAKNYLKRVSKCEIPIELPNDPEPVATVQPTSGTPRICAPARQFTRRSADGI